MTEVIRYPRNSVTAQGAYYFLKGIHPRVRLTSPDGSVVFEILGGGAIADKHAAPECVVLNAPPKGLIAPWKFIDQQGANEDGVTNLNAVNDAMEITLPVRLFARDGAHLRELRRTLLGSLDKKKTSQLSWFTHELGFWWGDVRHLRPPASGYDVGGQKHSTSFDLHLRVDGGSWRSFDHVDEFRLPFDSMKDTFSVDTVVSPARAATVTGLSVETVSADSRSERSPTSTVLACTT